MEYGVCRQAEKRVDFSTLFFYGLTEKTPNPLFIILRETL